jgi:hypothetical protein
MTAITWRRGRVSNSNGPQLAVLLTAAFMLAQCSSVPLADVTQSQPPDYGRLVSASLKGFKDFASNTNYQISAPRWVHAAIGWSWLACARFLDHGRQRYYAVFMKDGAVALSRYDVRTDRCAEQQYVPFDAMTGAVPTPPPMGPPPAGGIAPPQPSFTLQQPIY